MDMVLYNPTDRLGKDYQEDFRGFYMGVGRVVKAGEKVKFSENVAKHLLTEFSVRGLVVLNFGDDAEEKAKEGLEKNREFKIKQLNTFNTTNEQHKYQRLPYLYPKEHLKKYAKELGVKLVDSFEIDDSHIKREKELREENAQLREDLRKLMDMVSDKLGVQTDESVVHTPESPNIPLNKDGTPDKRFKNKEDPGV